MIKILFIGNSHTYFNDMVQMFINICNQNNIDIHATMLSHGGKNLLWHSDEHEVRFNILYGGYDYVVLQDAAHPFVGEDNLLNGVKKIKEFINKTNAKTVLYMTWAEKIAPENQNAMSSAYKLVAEKTDSILAPVGDYWNDIVVKNPNIELFADDGEHASKLGSFLASNILYIYIFDKTPVNIDIQTIIKDFNTKYNR